jgi:hypothetical protein
MKFMKISLATTIGFIFGAMLFHTPTAKANPQRAELVHVYIYPVLMVDAKTPFPKDLPGC